MLMVDGKDIRISCGDTFEMTFTVEGVGLHGMEAWFSVTNGRTTISEEMTVGEGCLSVILPPEKMKKLTPGRYIYDVCIKNKTTRKTLNFPARLEIVEVCHAT